MSKPKSLPERWLRVYGSTPEKILYGALAATVIAASANEHGTARIDLRPLQAVLDGAARPSYRVNAGRLLLDLVEAGWLAPVDVDELRFKLSIPSDLGPVPGGTSYVPADAVKRPVGRKGWMKPQKVKAR